MIRDHRYGETFEYSVEAGLVSIERGWTFWLAKNPGGSLDEGAQKVLLHLAGIESRRPLESISDAAERARAAAVRQWFKQQFAKT